jgi:hypothetical protein
LEGIQYATGVAPAMCMRLMEVGSQYIVALVDSKGEYQTRSMLQPP